MKFFVFRNATLEPFFPRGETDFSGYGDVSHVPADSENFLWFYTFPQEISGAAAEALAEDFLTQLKLTLARVPAEKNFYAVRLCPPGENLKIVALDDRAKNAVEKFNAALDKIARERENFCVVSVPAKILNDIDWRFYFSAQIPFSPKHAGTFAKILRDAKKLSATENFEENAEKISVPATRKKCLALDLDGTLWGGVLGEDGVGGIRTGGDYPGNAFAFFQKKISELAASGIILAISSKNNAADVARAFEKNPEMRLRESDFSAKRIDWRDKATHLREIAAELNIGADAIVFVDNDPRERELVRRALPEIAVPDFPARPHGLPAFFQMLLERFFRAEKLTAEDLRKTAQYRENARRAEFAERCETHEEYLASLETQLTVFQNAEETFPRLAQLSQKTNQFNLAGKRLAENDLHSARERGADVFALGVSDRFGDSGIVGLAVVERRGGNAEITEFLLSCRALGRGIENAFLEEILRRERDAGIAKIFAEFVPTAKNIPAKNFYARNGFSEISDGKFAADLRSRGKILTLPIYKIFSK